MTLTADWTDGDIAAELAFCHSVGIEDPTVPVQVWANESDNHTVAWNRNGNASGVFQLMPATAKGLGWDIAADPTLGKFRSLSVTQQLGWATKFYGNHKEQVGTVSRFYLCTFLPALVSCGDDMKRVVAGREGPYAGAYAANWGAFDALRDHLGHPIPDADGHPQQAKGYITVADLVDAAHRATGPRTRELIARILAAKEAQDADTIPES